MGLDRLPLKTATFESEGTFCRMTGVVKHGGEPDNGNYKAAQTLVALTSDNFRKFHIEIDRQSDDDKRLFIEVEGTSERWALANMFEMMAEALKSQKLESEYYRSVYADDYYEALSKKMAVQPFSLDVGLWCDILVV